MKLLPILAVLLYMTACASSPEGYYSVDDPRDYYLNYYTPQEGE